MTLHSPVILDVAGLELTAADRRRLKHPLTGGVILFGRNWHDRAQLLQLTSAIKSVRSDLLVCVDHEGGRVQRFRSDGFTQLPAMRALGQLWQQDGAAGKNRPGRGIGPGGEGSGALRASRAATAAGYLLAAELRACGVDFSFTPVLDLDHGDSSVIGDRAFHRDPRVVSLLAKSLVHGLLQAGMASCGKHFPGHGFSRGDSHIHTALDQRSLKAILADDAAPYAWLGNVLSSVMPAHVIYPKVDVRPAGFSKRWLGDILRGQLRFTGAIFSDDLGMEAARRIDGHTVSYTDAALAALQAGCDMVLLCNQSVADQGAEAGSAIDLLLAGMTTALEVGQWQARPESEARRLALLPQTVPLAWDELMFAPAYMEALSCLP